MLLPGATGETLPTHGRMTVARDALHVYDDVLADLPAYTAAVRALTFGTVRSGVQDFHGIAECQDVELAQWVGARFPHATPTVTFFRRSPDGQVEPNYIHADYGMGDWSGILYLTETPAAGDGTVFWRHRDTGAIASIATTPDSVAADWARWQHPDQWMEWTRVEARPNRLVLFPSALYHSRAIHANYGDGATARLIQVMFGTGSLEQEALR